jgi:hypothetical protein
MARHQLYQRYSKQQLEDSESEEDEDAAQKYN